ncbi:transposase family protein, partial [Limosilactobacillus sp. WF-MA3-C]|nr:transposase family protein [Limosilactobacillus fastidiosus]
MQMSLNNSILNLLGIEDRNIKVLNVETTSKNNEQLKVTHASLSYPVARCKNCGFETVVKNGFRKTHLRLASLNGMRYEMILAKQRYYCSNCQTTFGATTDLTKPNQTLTRKLKSQIMLF